jgi:hypothetical protein
LPVNDDAVAAGGAAVLGPLALPAATSRDLGVLGLAHQGDQLQIALAPLDDRDLSPSMRSAGGRADSDVSGIGTASLLPREPFGPIELLAVPR